MVIHRIFICVLTLLYGINLMAVELISGSLDSLKNETKISVSLDCTKCVFKANKKDLAFEYFLDKYPRHEKWEEESLKYFIYKFNKITADNGFIAIADINDIQCRYKMIIIPLFIYKNGRLEANVNILDSSKDKIVAQLKFNADGDYDDKITLRDPLKTAGVKIGRLFKAMLGGFEADPYDDIYFVK